MLTYTIVLTPEEDGSAINVEEPALSGVLTWGTMVEDAFSSARDAIELQLEGYLERGLPFSSASPVRSGNTFHVRVRPPLDISRRSA